MNEKIKSDVPNADSNLAVQFYSKAVQNDWESEKMGRPIFADVDFVKIWTPGDQLSIIDTPARDDHKKRFPLHWAHYQNNGGGDTREMGTPLSQWTLLTAARVEELKGLKFFTVDAVANASDAQLQALGMAAGMSPFAFRDRARAFLKLAQNEADSNQAEEQVKALQAENARIKAETEEKLAAMQEQIQALAGAANGNKKRGRKPNAGARE